MEILYFISGVLSVGILYGVKLLRTVKSSHTDLLARYQSQSNISSIRYGDLSDDLKTVEDLVMDISSKMEKDQYESMSEVNKRVSELEEFINVINGKVSDSNKSLTSTVSNNINEIQQLKSNLKALGQDPNFLNRY